MAPKDTMLLYFYGNCSKFEPMKFGGLGGAPEVRCQPFDRVGAGSYFLSISVLKNTGINADNSKHMQAGIPATTPDPCPQCGLCPVCPECSASLTAIANQRSNESASAI